MEDSESEPPRISTARPAIQVVGFYGFLLLQIANAIALVAYRASSGWSFISLTIQVIVLFLLGELSIFPFVGRQAVGYQIPFYASVLMLTFFANYGAHHPPAQWYPTNDSAWGIAPFALYGLASGLRGWRIETVKKRR